MAYKHLGPPIDDSAPDAESPLPPEGRPDWCASALDEFSAPPPPAPPEPTFDVFEADDGTVIVELREPQAGAGKQTVAPSAAPSATTPDEHEVKAALLALAQASLRAQQAREHAVRRNVAQVALYARTGEPASRSRGQFIDQKV